MWEVERIRYLEDLLARFHQAVRGGVTLEDMELEHQELFEEVEDVIGGNR